MAGALAGLCAIAVGELAAGLLSGAPSLVIAIGDLVIDIQPPGAKDLVVGLLGTNDKLALNVAILGAAIALAAALGVAGRRRWRTAVIGFSALGAVTALAALREPLVSPVLAIFVPVAATAVSLAVLRALLAAAAPVWAATSSVAAMSPTISTSSATSTSSADPDRNSRGVSAAASMPDWDRRRFLMLGGSVALGSVAAGVFGRSLLDAQPRRAGSSAATTNLPQALAPAASLPPNAALDVQGITPLVMPNNRFYKIDTTLIVPRVDVTTWQLRVGGMVDREVVASYPDLLQLPLFEQYVTIACVSNRVGGDLVGNAKWTGVHLRDVLEMAGVQSGATQIVGRSVDGFTVGFPTEWAMDPARDPMIAIGMNGETLPPEHGYPARLIVPGLYGYVSATKWLAEIELTTLDAFDAYWVRLGWAKEAPILTQSRIDVPRNGTSLAPGPVAIAGVAWAPDRGVSKVEVKIDDGEWQPATLSVEISKATWVQWRYDWAATAGSHRIEVRATDGTGEIQTDQESPPPPDGARGHHRIQVQVG